MSDELVERVARALAAKWRERAKEPNWPGDLLESEFDDLARAALSALPSPSFIVTTGDIGEPVTIQPADNSGLLREALDAFVHIEEYWNGSRTDGAMSDALDEIVATARAAADKIRAAMGGEK